ncbi:phosphoenolpyruvate carboxykinase (ATP) [Loigolactobacillus bifermentans]|uniref:phosphoenolpyruvate carboxykinase (ATP) n=1 Tax=Loigolactobacillus bifermentans DSM 20003 TaxID=1423726 RepID=A0A0R1GJU1_9LACO|nr:phosphoenolpyruvate carboxykinase (ATP) [Loigolactobacillus bifermentans]KRK34201.1 phosphoenolpyruvate carboxykinase [Loigolactobacillus bifermentans DSM 20003]QGG59314.1 phosphoenolpyruvate carboxykinase (ATP) [Loigolactobacillus bifermentans]
MTTQQFFSEAQIRRHNPLFSATRTTIETAFYQNNMTAVQDLTTAYQLAAHAPNTIVTDLPIYQAAKLGLPADAKMLVDNHGAVVGRTAAARHILTAPNDVNAPFVKLLREAIYQGHSQAFYQTEVVVGLAPSFMVKAHLALPKGFEANLLSYLLNFQVFTTDYAIQYATSQAYPEGDLYLYADPNFHHPDYPNGLTLFDPVHNCAAILGLRYFGELKKATLTLAWALAHRNGFVACHGGEKAFHFKNRSDQVFAMFGLSGSGKSTLTHAKHQGHFDITVLHDDAFVISKTDGHSVALEPAYFDKTNDYPSGTPETKYFMTLMNVGVTVNQQQQKVLVTEDLRNGNGRTVKSRFASTNRVDEEPSKINAICWIMKDDALPPIVKVNDPTLAAAFGATLATKRSSAENLVGNVDRTALVIEPFANPFRVYPLSEDYADFKQLFEQQQVACYILNTGQFQGQDIPKEVTLAGLEQIVQRQITWQPIDSQAQLSWAQLPEFPLHTLSAQAKQQLQQHLQFRLDWLTDYQTQSTDSLPTELAASLATLQHHL